MQNADNLDSLGLRAHTIDDDEGRSRDHQLAGAGNSSAPTDLGMFAQQNIGTVPDRERHCQGTARAFLLDVVEDAVEIGVGFVLPYYRDAQAPVPFRRAIRASSLLMTVSCENHCASPLSARASDFSTSPRNHASCSPASCFCFMRSD